MVNQICFWSFPALFSGILFKRSRSLLSMGGDSKENEVLGIPSSYHSAPEYNEIGKQDWSVKTNVLW